MDHILTYALITQDHYTSLIPAPTTKLNTMSGIEKHSEHSANEIEIPLDIEEPLITAPKPQIKIEPEYYECSDNYSIFE